MKRPLIVVAIVAALLALGPPAAAAPITFTAPMTGSYNSDTQNASFLAALGLGYTHISFSGATDTNGGAYSSVVTFSTKDGVFGGSNTSLVNAVGEIGPYGTWDGILNIDFLANGYTMGTVGFGLVEFDSAVETIRVYNELNALVGTYNNQLGDTFSLWGISGNAGERIGRLELDGNFFAIRDIEFSGAQVSNSVPDPGSTLLLFGLGLVGLRAWRKRLQ